MPAYEWKGVDVKGTVHTGVLFSSSYEELRVLLEKRSLGLISAHRATGLSLSSAHQQELLTRLSSLLGAHIPLHTALVLIGTLTKEGALGIAVKRVADAVEEGITLSEAFIRWSCVDALTVAVVRAGEKTGDMATALEHLIKHRMLMEVFKKRVRAALRVPCITLCFFMISVLGILVGIVPIFERYCTSYSSLLPASTRLVLYISSLVRSWKMLYVVISVSIGCAGLVLLVRLPSGRTVKDFLLASLPVLGSLLLTVYTAQVLRGLSLLLQRGVPLVQALEVCLSVHGSLLVQEELKKVVRTLEQGKPFSEALKASIFSSEELYVCIVLGESTGHLDVMVSTAADLFQERAYSNLEWYITCITPFLLVCLGFLIAGLIYAVYMPLLTISLHMG